MLLSRRLSWPKGKGVLLRNYCRCFWIVGLCGKLLRIFNIISAHYERLFKDLQTQIHGEAVTGLLLIYPVHIIHVIEVREDIFCKTMCSILWFICAFPKLFYSHSLTFAHAFLTFKLLPVFTIHFQTFKIISNLKTLL